MRGFNDQEIAELGLVTHRLVELMGVSKLSVPDQSSLNRCVDEINSVCERHWQNKSDQVLSEYVTAGKAIFLEPAALPDNTIQAGPQPVYLIHALRSGGQQVYRVVFPENVVKGQS